MEPAQYSGLFRTKDSSLRHAAKSPSSNPVRDTLLRYSAGMIWSVSTLLRRSGTPTPVWVVNLSMAVFLRSGSVARYGLRDEGRWQPQRSAGLDRVPRRAVAAATTG